MGIQTGADILLVTVTEVEARAVFRLFEEETGHKSKQCAIGEKTYFELGEVGGVSVWMVQSGMGSGGLHGSLLAVHESIRVLSLSTVIMVGIAFGMNPGPGKQKIGDILVSQQLLSYDLQKVSTGANGQIEITVRGDRASPPRRVFNRFRSAIFCWNGPRVQFGLLLSGDKLIDHKGFRDQLLQLEPESTGGEMEGAGLYAAAQLHKVDWLIVKAISDWADGSKDHNQEACQKEATENAVHFTIHVLRQGGFAESIAREAQGNDSADKCKGATTAPAIGTLLRTYDIHSSWVVAVAWEPCGNRIASAGGDGAVRVWDTETGNTLLTYRGHSWRLDKINMPTTIYNIAWSPERLRIASAGNGTKVHVWNAATGQNLSIYQGHTGLMAHTFAIGWSPDGSRIASACSSTGFDQTVYVWDVNTARSILRYEFQHRKTLNFSVLALKWSPDGSRIASTCEDKTIRVWEAATGRHLLRCCVKSKWVSNIAWSPDSKRIAAALNNGIAQIWDAEKGEHLLTYYGHGDSVRDIAWSPDGSHIATASNDKTVHIWEPIGGERLFVYRGHSNWTTSLAWSPDGTCIASASNDRTVQIWRAR